MYATVNAPTSNQSDYQRARWEAMLAQGAIAERIAGQSRKLAEVISGSTITLQSPDLNEPKVIGGGAGDVAAGMVFGASTAQKTDEQIAASVKTTLARFDLAVTDVRVLHPLGSAVDVVTQTNNPKSLAGQFDALLKALKGDNEYEGSFLEIDGPDGRPLLEAGAAERVAGGTVWFADGMDSIMGINHGASPGQHRLSPSELRHRYHGRVHTQTLPH